MPKTKATVVITQAQVDRFAKVCAMAKELDKERRSLRELFMKARDEKVEFPDTGPYLIHFIDKSMKDLSWREETRIIARQLFGSAEKADDYIREIEEDAEIKPVVEVTTRDNPNFEAVRVPITATKRPALIGRRK